MANDPPDEISEWSIVVAHSLVEVTLANRINVGHIHAAMDSRVTSYQVLCALARTAGLILRPNGYEGGPLALEGEPRARILARMPADNRARIDALLDLANAERLLGFAASGDDGMVRAIALAVINADADGHHARAVAGAMLTVLALLPVDPTIGRLPHDPVTPL